jgi:hypothetical protein
MGDKPVKVEPASGGDVIVPNDQASAEWARQQVALGYAKPATPGQPLAPGVLYEIIGETPAGAPILKHRRVSLT